MSMKENLSKKKSIRFADLVKKIPTSIIDPRKGRTEYVVGAKVGSGSFGKCFILTESKNGKKYAGKILSKKGSKLDIKNEVNIHINMKHQHVVDLIRVIDDKYHIYMIQTLCSNGTLKDLLKKRETITIDECRYIVSQILSGAYYIHGKNIIHRDFKLANIFIDGQMQMKIGDFGLAIRTNDKRLKDGEVCGTIRYLAPEVLQRNGFSFKSDIWAIGVMMYNLLFGMSPFLGDTNKETVKHIRKIEYSLPAELDDDAKKMFEEFFKKNVIERPYASECLQHAFISKHFIPKMLPASTLTKRDNAEYLMETPKEKSEAVISTPETDETPGSLATSVQNPVITVLAEQNLQPSVENGTHAVAVRRLHDIFELLCRTQESNQNRIANSILTDQSELRPHFWVTEWSHESNIGIVYRVANAVGILSYDGVKIMRTLSKRVYKTADSTANVEELHEKIADFEDLIPYLTQITNSDPELDSSCSMDVNEIPFLHTWFRTMHSMVLFLANQIIQINFARSQHKTIIIDPRTESITFVEPISETNSTNRMTTTKIEQISSIKFNSTTLVHLKRVSLLLKRLADNLDGATSTKD